MEEEWNIDEEEERNILLIFFNNKLNMISSVKLESHFGSFPSEIWIISSKVSEFCSLPVNWSL